MHSSAYNDGFVLYWIKATYIKYDICLEILTLVKKIWHMNASNLLIKVMGRNCSLEIYKY